jgi:hypothetical protein
MVAALPNIAYRVIAVTFGFLAVGGAAGRVDCQLDDTVAAKLYSPGITPAFQDVRPMLAPPGIMWDANRPLRFAIAAVAGGAGTVFCEVFYYIDQV